MRTGDEAQRKRIRHAPADARLLVEAGPGTGKTEMAAVRMAGLVRKGLAPGQLLVLSFSRSAVRNLTDRLARLEGTDDSIIEELRHVSIRTFDSWAFRMLRLLRNPLDALLARGHDDNIEKLTALFGGRRREEIRELIGDRRHLIVDEFQDLPGVRGELVLALLDLLVPPARAGAGFTILGDPAQAIYAFAATASGSTFPDLPFHQDWQKTPITRAEDRTGGRTYLDDVFARAVTPDYFRMHGIRMLAGMSFAPADADGARPVAIVSRTLAERLWPDRDALGRELRAGRADSSEPWLTVVGIAADVRRVPHEPPTATLYRPVRQQSPSWLYLMMRTRTAEPAGLAASVRQAVWAEDSRQPVEGPWVIAGWVREMTGLLRFTALIGLTFSSLGVLLALTGVYGLTADLSRRAIREIGIRKALGATRADVVRPYLLRVASPTIPALLAGGFGGTVLVRTLASEIDGVASPQLWMTFLVATLFGTLVIVAAYLASRRAAEADPALTLRVD